MDRKRRYLTVLLKKQHHSVNWLIFVVVCRAVLLSTVSLFGILLGHSDPVVTTCAGLWLAT